MIILDGRKISTKILKNIKAEVSLLNFQPVFCDVLVGSDSPSAQYVSMKAAAAEKVGIKFRKAEYPESITTEELVGQIKKINKEPNMCGLIVQLPLPKSIDSEAVLNAIDPKIDVDATGLVNTTLFYKGNSYLDFPTAASIMSILESTGEKLENKTIVVIGQGRLVGKPVSFLLQQKGLNVKIVNNETDKNGPGYIKEADVLISAAGKPKLITGNKIKTGSIIIDAGTSESDGGIVGDVDLESVKEVAAYVSPVPGGVGPVTVAMLLANVLKVAKKF